jgi:hypothetical protein
MDYKIFVHYGSDHFDPSLFREASNAKGWNPSKPFGGMWGTPEGSSHGWADWCRSEGYRVETLGRSFEFRLRAGTRVLYARKLSDLKPIMTATKPFMRGLSEEESPAIDFDEARKRYDAIVAVIDEDGDNLFGTDPLCDIDFSKHPLTTWDCDSILVLNRGCVVETKKSQSPNVWGIKK